MKHNLETKDTVEQLSLLNKKCSTCKEIKLLNLFSFEKRAKDGYTSQCKKCVYEATKKWQRENPEKIRAARQRWVQANPEKQRAAVRRWEKANPEKQCKKVRRWQKTHPERARAIQCKSDAKRRSTPQGRLNNRMAVNICHSLHGKKGGRHWETLVGYTLSALMAHIEKQFKDGMGWENVLKGEIHIDHIIPKSVFNFEKPEDDDFRRCWALSNLQPLWAIDNLKKSNKLEKHFQPRMIF